MTSEAICKHVQCDHPAGRSFGLCGMHYQRWRKYKGCEDVRERAFQRFLTLHRQEFAVLVAEELAKAQAEYGMS